jgi:hypothetical protein
MAETRQELFSTNERKSPMGNYGQKVLVVFIPNGGE